MGMSKFQIIFTAIFGLFIIVGVFIFAFSGRGSSNQTVVTVWGHIPQSAFSEAVYKLPIRDDKALEIRYVYKNPADFERDFLEALAGGSGPDIVILAAEDIMRYRNMLFLIPYQSYAERTFKDTFIEAGEIFLARDGFFALPFLVDPMVMYWNRDMFSKVSIGEPPRYWDEFFELSKKITVKDGSLNITKATLPLGEYENVKHAKDILLSLIFQAGNVNLVRADSTGYKVNLLDLSGKQISPSTAALNFFTEFSNPSKVHYSWNRALPLSENMFTSGDLALYFGYASERALIRLKNPNLNFEVAAMPQSRAGERPVVYGRVKGLAVTRNTKNLSASFRIVSALTSQSAIDIFSQATNLPPVRRDLIARGPRSGSEPLFYQAALISKGCLDPSQAGSGRIFKEMIESITGGRVRTDEAIAKAQQELNLILS